MATLEVSKNTAVAGNYDLLAKFVVENQKLKLATAWPIGLLSPVYDSQLTWTVENGATAAWTVPGDVKVGFLTPDTDNNRVF